MSAGRRERIYEAQMPLVAEPEAETTPAPESWALGEDTVPVRGETERVLAEDREERLRVVLERRRPPLPRLSAKRLAAGLAVLGALCLLAFAVLGGGGNAPAPTASNPFPTHARQPSLQGELRQTEARRRRRAATRAKHRAARRAAARARAVRRATKTEQQANTEGAGGDLATPIPQGSEPSPPLPAPPPTTEPTTSTSDSPSQVQREFGFER